MNILGIDPGKGGGLCFMYNEKNWIINMPDSPEKFHRFLLDMRKDHGQYIVFIEKVQMWMSDTDEVNRGKAFNVAKMLANYNMLLTALRIIQAPTIEVSPRTWQNTLKDYGVKPKTFNNPKNAWKLFAVEKFRNPKITLKTADACCIAWWGKQQVASRPNWVMESFINDESKNLFNIK